MSCTHRRPRAAGVRSGILLASAVVTGGLVTRAGAAGSPALTAEQQQRLADGEIIVLDTRPPAPARARAVARRRHRAGPWSRLGVLTDYPRHPRYYPKVVDAAVLEVSGARVIVRYTVRIGIFTFRFHMRKVSDPLAGGSNGAWMRTGPRPVRENSGYWLVEAHPGGSLVTYAIAVRSYVPAFLTAGERAGSLARRSTAAPSVGGKSGDPSAPST